MLQQIIPSGPALSGFAEIRAAFQKEMAERSANTTKAWGRIGLQEVIERAAKAMARKLPTTLHCKNTAREWAIIGGGPSLKDSVDDIRRLKRNGVNIVSVNKSHDWLLDRGIVPWAHVLLDPKEWVSEYVQRPRRDVRYFVASQCHDKTFDALQGYPVFLWHAGQDFPEVGQNQPHEYLRQYWPNTPWHLVEGATTVGLRAPRVGHSMPNGPDVFHMIGMDSSRTNGKLHAYDKPEARDAATRTMKLQHDGKFYLFDTNSHMSQQLEDFDQFIAGLADSYKLGNVRPKFKMKFYGSGLLPFFAAKLGLHANPECNADPTKVGGWVSIKDAKPASQIGQVELSWLEQRKKDRELVNSPEFQAKAKANVEAIAASEKAALAAPVTIKTGPVNVPLDDDDYGPVRLTKLS